MNVKFFISCMLIISILLITGCEEYSCRLTSEDCDELDSELTYVEECSNKQIPTRNVFEDSYLADNGCYCTHLDKEIVTYTYESVDCCSDSDCGDDETCANNQCIISDCGECQYLENGACVDYACCSDSDCNEEEYCLYEGTQSSSCEDLEEQEEEVDDEDLEEQEQDEEEELDDDTEEEEEEETTSDGSYDSNYPISVDILTVQDTFEVGEDFSATPYVEYDGPEFEGMILIKKTREGLEEIYFTFGYVETISSSGLETGDYRAGRDLKAYIITDMLLQYPSFYFPYEGNQIITMKLFDCNDVVNAGYECWTYDSPGYENYMGFFRPAYYGNEDSFGADIIPNVFDNVEPIASVEKVIAIEGGNPMGECWSQTECAGDTFCKMFTCTEELNEYCVYGEGHRYSICAECEHDWDCNYGYDCESGQCVPE